MDNKPSAEISENKDENTNVINLVINPIGIIHACISLKDLDFIIKKNYRHYIFVYLSPLFLSTLQFFKSNFFIIIFLYICGLLQTKCHAKLR